MSETKDFTLKLADRLPDELPLDRLSAYLKEFALLLGKDNAPVFSSLREGSVKIAAKVSVNKVAQVERRLADARQNHSGKSNAANYLRKIEELMQQDGISHAEILNPIENTLIKLHAANEPILYAVEQDAEVDGEITGVVGADDTMLISIREWSGRIRSFTCKDIALAVSIAQHLRNGVVRLFVNGKWLRTDTEWKPDTQRCYVEGFEILDETPLTEVFANLRAIPDNGWKTIPDPDAVWRELRGIDDSGGSLQ